MVDEVLMAKGLKRQVKASTTHFAALPYLLLGSDAVATILCMPRGGWRRSILYVYWKRRWKCPRMR